MNSFLPPVVFEVKATATEAITSFKKVNDELAKMEKQAKKTGESVTQLDKISKATALSLLAVGTAVTVALGASIKASVDQEKALQLLNTAVKNTGQNFAAALPEINTVTRSLIELGFEDNVTYQAMAKLTAATGDVRIAMRSMSVAADLARFKQISLTEAADLLARATTGQAKGLRDLGIKLDTTAGKTVSYDEILKVITQRIGGTAEAFGNTAAGKFAVFNAKVDELKETIGNELLPYVIQFTDWLNKKAIPAVEKFVKFLADNKDKVIQFGLAIAGLFIGVKIGAWITAMVTGIGVVVNALKVLRNTAVAAAIAEMFVLNPLGGIAMAATIGATLLAVYKSIDMIDKLFNKDTTSEVNAGVSDRVKDYESIGAGAGRLAGDTNKLSDALINARQRFKDFSIVLSQTATTIADKWKTLIGRDTADAIRYGLLDPSDQLIEKSKTLIDAYTTASSKFASANSQLTFAQKAYEKAVQGTDKTLIASTESALKRAEELVKSVTGDISNALDELQKLQDQLINQIVESYKKIDELSTQRTETLAQANADRLQLEKDYNKNVLQLQTEYQKNVQNAQAEAVKRSAEIVKQSVDQLRGIFKTATSSSIGEIFSNLTFQGRYLAGGTASALTQALGLRTTKAKTLADNAAKLAALGFSQTFIEEVVAQGPDIGNSLAESILTATPESITELQKYWIELQKVSSHGVDTLANKLNSDITLATEELTQQLAQVQIDLQDTLKNYQVELTTALASAFSEYSSALDAINVKTAQTVASIDKQINTLKAQIASMQSALASLPTSVAAPSTGVPTATVTPVQPMYDPLSGLKVTAEDARARALGELGTASKSSTNIYFQQNNLSNASPDYIADSAAWKIRTSADISYTKAAPTTTPALAKYGLAQTAVSRTSATSGTSQRGD